MKAARKMAFCGLIAALSLTLLLLSGVLFTVKLSIAAVAGAMLAAVVLREGRKAAWISFFAVAALSFILLPNKDAAVFYAAFFGYYPILKSRFECLEKKKLEYALKFLVFNLAAAILFFLLKETLLGALSNPPWILIAGFLSLNVVFFFYDRALGGFIAWLYALLCKIQK